MRLYDFIYIQNTRGSQKEIFIYLGCQEAPIMGTCDRCGDEYESYSVFFTKDPSAIRAYKKLREDGFKNLCKPCRKFLVQERNITGHAFTTENENIEPKEDPNN